jgi:hypothetical protein
VVDPNHLNLRFYLQAGRYDDCLVHSNKSSMMSRPPCAAPPPAPAPGTPAERAYADPPGALAEWRSAALRALFPLTFSHHARPDELRRAVAVYHYFAGARTADDLRRRVAEVRTAVERGL